MFKQSGTVVNITSEAKDSNLVQQIDSDLMALSSVECDKTPEDFTKLNEIKENIAVVQASLNRIIMPKLNDRTCPQADSADPVANELERYESSRRGSIFNCMITVAFRNVNLTLAKLRLSKAFLMIFDATKNNSAVDVEDKKQALHDLINKTRLYNSILEKIAREKVTTNDIGFAPEYVGMGKLEALCRLHELPLSFANKWGVEQYQKFLDVILANNVACAVFNKQKQVSADSYPSNGFDVRMRKIAQLVDKMDMFEPNLQKVEKQRSAPYGLLNCCTSLTQCCNKAARTKTFIAVPIYLRQNSHPFIS